MKHLYPNDDDEIVASDTAEQAGIYHDCELGGKPEPIGTWTQIPDESMIPIATTC